MRWVLFLGVSFAYASGMSAEQSNQECEPLDFSYYEKYQRLPTEDLRWGALFYPYGEPVSAQCAKQIICEVDDWVQKNAGQSYYLHFQGDGEAYMWSRFAETMPNRSTARLGQCNIYLGTLCDYLEGQSDVQPYCGG